MEKPTRTGGLRQSLTDAPREVTISSDIRYRQERGLNPMTRKDNKLSKVINDAIIEASRKITEEANQKGVDFMREYARRAHKQKLDRTAEMTRIARLESTLDTVLFHLRRGDHADPLCGRRCTNQMIDAISRTLNGGEKPEPPNE